MGSGAAPMCDSVAGTLVKPGCCDDVVGTLGGPVRGWSPGQRGAALLGRVVARGEVCLRRLGGRRADEVRFGRFLANPRVTVERLIGGWSECTAAAARGRHVLAIQDTSELNFRTTPERRRGLGEIGKGVGRGVLLHAMLALDAEHGACLGLVTGAIWTRAGRVSTPAKARPLEQKESRRWLTTAECAKGVLSAAAQVTVIADRESDIYAEWARLPAPGFDLITRVMHDRALSNGGLLYTATAHWPEAGKRAIDVPARGPQQPARRATLALRFGTVSLRRPKRSFERDLPASVTLTLVEVVECDAPPDAEPIHWRLLTTHGVTDAEKAWRIVDWYTARWVIEQLFRTLKTQGLKIEDSQLDSAESLIKLTAIAAHAAVIILQLVQARDGRSARPARDAFAPEHIAVLERLNTKLQGRTTLQQNPHSPRSLAWAAWIIGRLGGWDGYPSSKPPGPITLKHGLDYFHAILTGWTLKDVCIP